ncbi:spidroin-2-like [Thalassophryne amazonica]|uniref:spidroin-2-like n=1 Tax=Thalassophryne amazonica TaxID=390379 RepID=UPI0014712F56|nr:spidroin-2-like [Thalassophryne amazonica]
MGPMLRLTISKHAVYFTCKKCVPVSGNGQKLLNSGINSSHTGVQDLSVAGASHLDFTGVVDQSSHDFLFGLMDGAGPFGPDRAGPFGPGEAGSFGPGGAGTFGPDGVGSFGPDGVGSFGPDGVGSFGPDGVGPFGPGGAESFGPDGAGQFGADVHVDIAAHTNPPTQLDSTVMSSSVTAAFGNNIDQPQGTTHLL